MNATSESQISKFISGAGKELIRFVGRRAIILLVDIFADRILKSVSFVGLIGLIHHVLEGVYVRGEVSTVVAD
jgi:hypothetical protein